MNPTQTPDSGYDALLVVSFGGPEGMDDVMPFLENVLHGRNVPRERMIGVAKHYELFGGVSPINGEADCSVGPGTGNEGAAPPHLFWQPQLASHARGHLA